MGEFSPTTYWKSVHSDVRRRFKETKTMTPDVLMNYSYRPPDMEVRVIMSRLEIKLGFQKMGMFLIVVYIEAPHPFVRGQNAQQQKKSGWMPVDERRKRGLV